MIDFTQREKRFLPVKLFDGTTVLLCTPKKGLYAKLGSLRDRLEDAKGFSDSYDEILSATADVLSNNKSGKAFSPDAVDAIMDIDDMALIVTEYMKFVGEVTSSPN